MSKEFRLEEYDPEFTAVMLVTETRERQIGSFFFVVEDNPTEIEVGMDVSFSDKEEVENQIKSLIEPIHDLPIRFSYYGEDYT